MDTPITLFAPSRRESPARRGIRRLSAPFAVIFAALGGLTALAALAVFAFAIAPGADAIWIGPENTWLVLGRDQPPPGTVSFRSLPLSTQLVAGAVFTAIAGSLTAAFAFLHRLFAHYQRGDVFGAAPQAAMKHAALALIVFALAPGGLQPLLRAVGSPDRAWFHGHSLAALLVGAALLVIARVMALGREIESETEEFV